MLKMYTATLDQVITVYNDMFDHMNGIMPAVARKKTWWKEDLIFTVNFVQQKLSKYCAEVTPTTGVHLVSVHIIDPFWKLSSFRKWDNSMDINPEDETLYITQYNEALLNYM
jgi:hypothetical protein